MSPVFIIDTNVIVAGRLTSDADSPVTRILDGMLRASFRFVVSEGLPAEYRQVLLRPKAPRLGPSKVPTGFTRPACWKYWIRAPGPY